MLTPYKMIYAAACLLLSLPAVNETTAKEAARPAQPNVLLIVVDDLGWQDVKCYDIDEPSPMETPHMDGLARQGALFRQAYSPAPVCSPSRAALLSGVHPARAQHVGVAGGNPPRPHHLKGSRMINPWDRGSLAPRLPNIATALRKEGYATGHCGKWHLCKSKQGGSQPTDVGFDWSRENHGVQAKMTPHRMTGFATRAKDDPYQLDEKGYPRDQNNQDALTFLRKNDDKPFFLYYATFLVHTPIHMRSRALLDKYVEKLGVELPENPQEWLQEGQTNPFYCATVEQLDYYLGQLFSYLDETDDPRWPGHKLSENTYVILTSDNGGMEGVPDVEIIAENAPLDEGKIHLQEGGVRVPLIITGPGIKAGTESDVMVNGLDFYPTILSLVGASKETDQKFDGCDLSALLLKDPTDANLVRDAGGKVRDTLMWHFPSSVWMESSIRVGDYKLMRNYDRGGLNSRWTRNLAPPLELYRLYNTESGESVRVDIEEQKNLVETMPEKARELDQRLTEMLTEMNATYPAYNPHYSGQLPHKDKVPAIVSHQQDGQKVEFAYREQGAGVESAYLIYTTEGDYLRAEWFRHPAKLQPGYKVAASLPADSTHYFLYLVDENNFLVTYPDLPKVDPGNKLNYSDTALKVK